MYILYIYVYILANVYNNESTDGRHYIKTLGNLGVDAPAWYIA